MTPLILAIKSYKYRIAYCFLKVNINVSYTDFFGKDALFYALQNTYIDGDYRIANLILKKHPNPNQTLLMLVKQGNIKLIKYLLDNINNNDFIINDIIFDRAIEIYSINHPIVELLNKYNIFYEK